MTHDDVRALLAAYAAGALDPVAAAAVHAHLASGCAACLDDVYRRPVGLVPEPPPPVEVVALFDPPPRAPSRLGRALAVAGLILLAAAVGGATWMALEARGRRLASERRVLERRVAEAEGQRTELAGRVTALEREVASAQSEAMRQAEAVRATAEESAQLRSDLEARIAALARRNTAIERQLGGAEERQALETLAATPGVELLRLDPVPPYRGPRGHVLLHPARETVMLYVFDLPPPTASGGYRVRLRGENGRVEEPELPPRPRGVASVPLHLHAAAGSLREVQILVDGDPILAGRRTTAR